MTTATKILLGIVGSVFAFTLIMVFSIMGMFNNMVKMENNVKYQYSQNQNNYDNMWKQFKEATQVTTMYSDDIERVFKASIQGRYGAGGSKAVFQMLQEHNPSIDSKMYTNIQQMIESGRVSFASEQKMLLDKKRQYETYIQSAPTSFVAGALGFPRIDLAKFDIVTSDETDKAFATKKTGEVKLR